MEPKKIVVGLISLVVLSTVYLYVGDYNWLEDTTTISTEDTTTISTDVNPITEINVNVNNQADKSDEGNTEPSEILPLTATIYPIFEAASPTTVTGTVSRPLADGEYMWIVVNPLDSFAHLWPQSGGPIVPGNDLKWRGVAWLGGDIGDDFDILVIVADKNLNSKISNWVEECTRIGDWPPITEKGVKKAEIASKALDTANVKLKN